MLDNSAGADIKPSDLPTPPQAALQLMRACAKSDISTTELSQLAINDPILTAELLRVVNSPFFGLSREIKSIPRAITVLGQRALHNLVLCISVRDALKTDHLKGFDSVGFWEDSLRRAVSARLLGEMLGVDVDECFTAGLLQDFGLLVMFFLHPEHASQWSSMYGLDPDQRYRIEQDIFNTTHDQVVMMLAHKWSLPDELTAALGYHHFCEKYSVDDKRKNICRIICCADWMTAVYSARNKSSVISRCHQLLAEYFYMDTPRSEKCLSKIPEQVEKAAEALGLRIKQQPDFDQIIRETNIKLAEENLSYQELTWQLENALKERDRLADELNRELELAREIQQSLLPAKTPSDLPIIGINVPARELSGDFYDYFRLEDGRILFNLGDVSGKGVNAALLMAKTSSLFRCLGKQIHSPSRLLAQINTEICETSVRGMFVTMVAGLYDPASGSLCIVNAGHPPGLLRRRDGSTRMLAAQSPPLGIVADTEFAEIEADMRGGCLYLFSDGVLEGNVNKHDIEGVKGFQDILLQYSNKPPMQRLEAIVDSLRDSSNSLRDDVTILIVEDRHGNEKPAR